MSLSLYIVYIHVKIGACTCEAEGVSAREAVRSVLRSAEGGKNRVKSQRATGAPTARPLLFLLLKSPLISHDQLKREEVEKGDAGWSLDGAAVAF